MTVAFITHYSISGHRRSRFCLRRQIPSRFCSVRNNI